MQILSIARAFPLQGAPVSYTQFGQGHINTTYKVTTDCGKAYILQQINQFVFRQPEKLMENAFAVTKYLQNLPGDHMVLNFLPTLDGRLCHQDEDGQYWRMYHFIPGKTMERVENAEDFYRSGLGFGHFQIFLRKPSTKPFPISTTLWTATASSTNPSMQMLPDGCRKLDLK